MTLTAGDVMTPNPETVTPETPVSEAWELMRERDIRHLPVVEGGALVGMLSDRDIGFAEVERLGLQAGLGRVQRRLLAPVIKVMSSDVFYVEPDTTLGETVALMLEGRVGALPVVRPGTRQVVGIVSYVDLLRVMQGLLEGA